MAAFDNRHRRRIDLDGDLWAVVDAIAAARETTPSRVISECVQSRIAAQEHSRIASELARIVRPLVDKIDLIFWHVAPSVDEDA